MIQLRPFQEEMIQEVRERLRSSTAVLLQLPTGGGKTVIAAFMIRNARAKGLRVWFVCHRDFLLDQTSMTLSRLGLEHSFICAGRPFMPGAALQICSIDTLKNRLEYLPQPDLIIWDEAHHVAAKGWAKIRGWAAAARNVGLSATPERLDGKGLDQAFDQLVLGPSVEWLIAQGYLSKYKAYAPSQVDLSSVHTVAGEYNQRELEEVMDEPRLIGDMVEHYRKYADGLRAVYFATTIKHSQHIAASFEAAGIPALHIDGRSATHERRSAARAFADGRVQVLVNVGLFGEGYDLAAQAGRDVTIEAVGLARPTQSLALHLQQIGRALRPKDRPAVILDHANNLETHGLPDDDREWTLEGRAKKKKKDGDDAPSLKTCPECFGIHKPFLKLCPYCGYAYAAVPRAAIEVADGELKEIDPSVKRANAHKEERDCKSMGELVALGRARGYKSPEAWAARLWMLRDRRGQTIAEAQWRAYARG